MISPANRLTGQKHQANHWTDTSKTRHNSECEHRPAWLCQWRRLPACHRRRSTRCHCWESVEPQPMTTMRPTATEAQTARYQSCHNPLYRHTRQNTVQNLWSSAHCQFWILYWPQMLENILCLTLGDNKDGGPVWGMYFKLHQRTVGLSCTKPITTKHRAVFWLVSQSQHVPAIFVGTCRWTSLAPADPVVRPAGTHMH